MSRPGLKTPVISLALCVGLAATAGCVPMQQQVPERGDIFEPLHGGDLAEFDHRLSLDEHAGRDDAWTDVGRAYLEFANCRPVDATPTEDVETNPEARLVWELIGLEDRRRLRMLHQAREIDHPNWRHATIHEQFSSPEFFDRQAQPADGDDLVRWPARPEHWPDEWPARRDIDDDCQQLEARGSLDEMRAPFDEIDADSVTGRILAEWLQTRRVDTAIDELDDTELTDRARRTIVAHRADLAVGLDSRDDARQLADETVDETLERTLDELLELADDGDDEMSLDVAMRVARLATLLEETETAIRAYRRLAANHPDDAIAGTSRYWATKLAWMQGRFDDAALTARPLAEQSDAIRSAHAYFAATAHRHTDREDEFLAVAREALRDRSRDTDDPFVGALYREVLRELAGYEVDERTEELLEEFGPRAELTIRKREFAEVALDMGRPGVAEEMVEPLFDEIHDARRIPRLHAILALAAFMRDDRPTFDHHIRALTDRPDELEEAIPPGRRAAFFAPRDTELARVLRATLPLMAEWGDDAGARSLRQQWLEALVEHTRDFLRESPETAVSRELADLYRLAGELLEEHPRGYAERVGDEEPEASALVLGTVDMAPAPPLDEAPRPQLRWPALPSLLLIPTGGLPPEEFADELVVDDGEESTR